MENTNFDGSQELIIQAVPAAIHGGDPDIFISRGPINTKPTENNNDYACSTFGKDTCSIHHNQINIYDVFYIGIRCKDDCDFQLTAKLLSEIVLQNGVELQLDFEQQELKLFTFYVPDFIGLSSNPAYEIKSVTIIASPFLPNQEDLILSVSTLNKRLPDSTTKRGVPAWTKGQVLRLTQSNNKMEWCTKCNITIMVDVSEAGRYVVMAHTNLAYPRIYEQKKFDDAIFFGDQQCYRYFSKSIDNDIYFKIQLFSGLISYSISSVLPNQTNFNLTSFFSNSTETSGSSLMILTADQRKAQDSVMKLQDNPEYQIEYLCIYSHHTSSFSILITEISKGQLDRIIENGFNEYGEIFGQQFQQFIYKVPPLKFSEEDIVLDFQVQVLNGNAPLLASKICPYNNAKGLLKCTGSFNTNSVFDKGTGAEFKVGKIMNNFNKLTIDHNEQVCRDVYKNECYYIIVLRGNEINDTMGSRYILSVNHRQQNHITLQENVQITDTVELNQVVYYKFSVIDESINIENITFKMTTLHGDSDLYVSRQLQKPNRQQFEKYSILGRKDIIYYDNSDPLKIQDLKSTYYIGVFGFQQSTYQLIAQVKRSQNSKSDLKSNLNDENALLLTEGIPISDTITQVFQQNVYKFQTKMLQGYEKEITIQLTPLQGQFAIYCSYQQKPTDQVYHFKGSQNMIQIKPSDINYHREGTYYIVVRSNTVFQTLFNTANQKYTILFQTQNQYTYLQTLLSQDMKQTKDIKYKYFRHFVSNPCVDISILMTVKSGNPIMYATVDPNKSMFPNETSFDFSSSQQNSQVISMGRSILIPIIKLNRLNPSCSDAGLTSIHPCVIFISVACQGSSNDQDCQYTLHLSYENSSPKLLALGQPLHGTVRETNYNYYYTVINKQYYDSLANQPKHKSMYVSVLTSLSGNTDLYIGFQTGTEGIPIMSSDTTQWKLPSQYTFFKKSEELLTADVIKLSFQEVLQNCFEQPIQNDLTIITNPQDSQECVLIFGVFGKSEQGSTGISATSLNYFKYQFVVYTDMLTLLNNFPQTSSVEEGEFQYYLYEAFCDKCTIVVSLSTFSNGDPDLYINYGDKRLPTKDDYDMSKTTYSSEVIIISKENNFFKSKNIQSLRGSYIIGVYGKKKSTYTISITAETYPMAFLNEGLSLKRGSQEQYEIAYFQFYNQEEQKDLKVRIDVKNGLVDLYMNTYDENKQHNLVERLPKSKRASSWILEGITPTVSSVQREYLIVKEDRKYCTQCVYIFGVVTNDKQAEYSILVQTLNADFKNSQILKIGEPQLSHLNTTLEPNGKTFKFMVDESNQIQVGLNVLNNDNSKDLDNKPLNSYLKAYLGFSDKQEEAFAIMNKPETITIDQNSQFMKTQRMYYLTVYAEGLPNSIEADIEFQVLVVQSKSIIRLQDGVPQSLAYQGNNDISKHMTIGVPKGESTISFYIKSKTQDFYPKLYFQFYEDIEEEMRLGSIQFPPNGSPGFTSYKKWDTNLNIMTFNLYKVGVKGLNAGYAITLFDSQMERKDNQIGEAVITISYSAEQRIMLKQTLLGTLENMNQFKLYRVDSSDLSIESNPQATQMSLLVEFSQCVGNSEIKFIQSPDKIFSTIEDVQIYDYENAGKQNIYLSLPRPGSVYIMVYPKGYFEQQNKEITKQNDDSTLFQIKVSITKKKNFKQQDFILPDQGHLEFQFQGSNNFNLTWKMPKQLIQQPTYSNQELSSSNVKYHILATTNTNAKLDSVCSLNLDVMRFYNSIDYQTGNTSYYFQNGKEGTSYLFNVIAQIKSENLDYEDEFLTYQPLKVYISRSSSVLTGIAFWFYIIAAIIFTGLAIYFWKQNKETQQLLEFEMSDVRNVASVHSTNRKLNIIKNERDLTQFQKLPIVDDSNQNIQ